MGKLRAFRTAGRSGCVDNDRSIIGPALNRGVGRRFVRNEFMVGLRALYGRRTAGHHRNREEVFARVHFVEAFPNVTVQQTQGSLFL